MLIKSRTYADDDGNMVRFELMEENMVELWADEWCYIPLERLRIIVEQLEEVANAQNN